MALFAGRKFFIVNTFTFGEEMEIRDLILKNGGECTLRKDEAYLVLRDDDFSLVLAPGPPRRSARQKFTHAF